MFGLFKRKIANSGPDPATLVPRIKHKNFLAALSAMKIPPQDLPVTEPLVGDLLITYAFDLPSAFMMCPVREMSRMGLSLAQLRARAVANLRPQAANVQLGGKPPVLV